MRKVTNITNKFKIVLVMFLIMMISTNRPVFIIALSDNTDVDVYITDVFINPTTKETTYRLFIDSKDISVLALDIDFEYNQEISPYVNIAYTSLVSDFIHAENATMPNEIRIALATTNGTPLNGQVLEITLNDGKLGSLMIGRVVVNDVLIQHSYLRGMTLDNYFVNFKSLNETSQIKPIFIPSDTSYTQVVYQSADESIAKVNDMGLITSVGFGKTQISVISLDGSYVQNAVVTISTTDNGEHSEGPNSPDDTNVIVPDVITIQTFYVLDIVTILVAIQNENTNEIIVHIDEGNTVLDSRIMEKLQQTGKTLIVQYLNDKKQIQYEWSLPGTGITDPSAFDAYLTKTTTEETNLLFEGDDYNLNIAHRNDFRLPTNSKIKIYVGNVYKDNVMLQLFVKEEMTNMFTLNRTGIKVLNGYVSFTPTTDKEYLITANHKMSVSDPVDKLKNNPYISISFIVAGLIGCWVLALSIFKKRFQKFKTDKNESGV